MNEALYEKNMVEILGEIKSIFLYDHETLGEKFYMVYVETKRFSENTDLIPVMVSERLLDIKKNFSGVKVIAKGNFRSYNLHEEKKNRLILSVFAREIEMIETLKENKNNNQIFLDGYLCKEPIYRTTQLGREISDLILGVNRQYNRSDYIPCIAWGRNARYASQLEVGTHIQLEGRIQSREYVKKLDDGTQETRTAYEVSVSRIDVVEESEG